jgi:hypothetical protein
LGLGHGINIGTHSFSAVEILSCSLLLAFPFSTELAGFIKKVRSKNKNSLSGLRIDEIVERVIEHILDEEKKKKVFHPDARKYLASSLFIYKM